jgi:hypothetical protein
MRCLALGIAIGRLSVKFNGPWLIEGMGRSRSLIWSKAFNVAEDT